MATPAPRVLLIGIDGADLEIIDRLIARGKLPTFARLEREGAFGPLKSQEPLLSPIVWTTIATGRNPQDHGILDFVEVGADGQPAPIMSTRRRVPALWNIASDFGKRVGFVGWYASYPAERVAGFEVSDRMGFHQVRTARAAKGATFPENLATDLHARFGEPEPDAQATRAQFVSDPASPLSEDGQKRLGELAKIYATSEFYRRIVPDLQKQFQPDLLAVYFEGIDACGHLFMEDASPRRSDVTDQDFRAFSRTVEHYYEYQDAILAGLLRLEGPETVTIVVSDHGFASGDTRPRISGRADTGKAALWHRLQGVLFLHGKSVRPGRLEGLASIYDVAPTVLALLQVPISRELSGVPLARAFPPGAHSVSRIEAYASPPRPAAPPPAPADPEAIRKLMALGYLSGSSSAIPHDPTGRTATSYFNEGLSLVQSGDAEKALRAYARALELDPRNSNALLAAVALKIQRRDSRSAAELLDRARQLDPNNFWVHLESASLALQLGDREKATSELVAAETIDNRIPSLFLVRARLFRLTRHLDRALEALDRGVRLSDQDRTLGEMLVLRAQIETDLGHMREAEESLRRAEPLAVPGLLAAARGDLAFARHEGPAAVEFFQKALTASPESSTLERRLGESLGALKDDERARAAFERAITKAQSPEEKEGAFGDLSILFQRQGRGKENLDTLLRATRELPDSAPLWAMLGAAYGRAAEYERAILAYERSVTVRPTALACKTLAALLFEGHRDHARAIALWRQSLALDPNQPEVREFLRRYAGTGS